MEKRQKVERWLIHWDQWGELRSRIDRMWISYRAYVFDLFNYSSRSAALNFAHVATGQLDMYQEIGCWRWDREQRSFLLVTEVCLNAFILTDICSQLQQLGCLCWSCHRERSRRQGKSLIAQWETSDVLLFQRNTKVALLFHWHHGQGLWKKWRCIRWKSINGTSFLRYSFHIWEWQRK